MAPEHFATDRAQQTWRLARAEVGCEYAGVCSASTTLSQMEIGTLERTEAAQREGIPSRAEDRGLRLHIRSAQERRSARHPSGSGQHRTCAEAAQQTRRRRISPGCDQERFPEQAYQSDPQEHRERTQSGPEEQLWSGFGAEVAGAD